MATSKTLAFYGKENLSNIANGQNDYVQRGIDKLQGWLDKEETPEEWEERFTLIRGRKPRTIEKEVFALFWVKTKELLIEFREPGWSPYVTFK